MEGFAFRRNSASTMISKIMSIASHPTYYLFILLSAESCPCKCKWVCLLLLVETQAEAQAQAQPASFDVTHQSSLKLHWRIHCESLPIEALDLREEILHDLQISSMLHAREYYSTYASDTSLSLFKEN